MKDEERIAILTNEVRPYLGVLQDAKQTILDQDVSKYPIFVLYKEDISMGVQLVDRNKVNTAWSLNASTLEEFSAKQIIAQEKVDGFRELFQKNDHHYCLFVVEELGANFVFIPE